jgi:DNA-binding protein HU-beta
MAGRSGHLVETVMLIRRQWERLLRPDHAAPGLVDRTAPPAGRIIPQGQGISSATKRENTMPSATKAASAAKKVTASGTTAAKATATKSAAPQVTVTLKQLAASLAESQDLPRKQAEAVLGELVALATQHLQKGDKIRLTGLGTLQVRARPARTGRNPATGATIQIAASKKIAFQPAKELKESV